MELYLYLIGPGVLALALQSVLCRRAAYRLLRHGTLLAPLVFLILTLRAMNAPQGFFPGLKGLTVLFYAAMGVSSLLGYGLAWLIYGISIRKQNRATKS